MLRNWITDVNGEGYQLHIQTDNFINSVPHVSSPPESSDESSLPDLITPPPTPYNGEDYPTPPPSRNDVFYLNYHDSSCSSRETEIPTATEERELPEFFDFLLDHACAGPKFQNVDEAKAFLLSSIDEFYSRIESERSASPLGSSTETFSHVSHDDRAESNQTPPLEVVYDGPIFQSVDEAKEYIMNAVYEFYSTISNDNSRVCSVICEETTNCQWESQNFGKSVNFVQKPVEFSF